MATCDIFFPQVINKKSRIRLGLNRSQLMLSWDEEGTECKDAEERKRKARGWERRWVTTKRKQSLKG